MSLPRGSHSNCGSQPSGWEPFFFACKPYRICNVYLASFCQRLENVWTFKNGKPMTAHLFPYALLQVCGTGVRYCYRSEDSSPLAPHRRGSNLLPYLLAWVSAAQKR